MKAAVARLGKDVESTAKIDPGVGFVEKKQQKRLQVHAAPTTGVFAPKTTASTNAVSGSGRQRCLQRTICAIVLAGADDLGMAAASLLLITYAHSSHSFQP